MQFVETALPGVVELRPTVMRDARGTFVKPYHRDLFAARGLRIDFAEEYWSVSQSRVLRGLHFQRPPHDHAKMVYCVTGKVLDAIVDLRVGSPAYGRYALIALDCTRGNGVFMPAGLAHGFYVLEPPATMIYKVTSVYDRDHDAGIRWDSAGIPWPDSEPILSDRDRAFPTLGEFRTPFVFGEQTTDRHR